jgi:hypothetical protein
MSESQGTRILALLVADQSPQRAELLALGFDALIALPLASFVDRALLLDGIKLALREANATLIAERHVLPAIERIGHKFEGRSERVREFVSPQAEQVLIALVRGGKGPRFHWLRGAIEPDDLRSLIAPIIQTMLLQFTSKLPIPGLSGAGGGGGGSGGGLGGLVGMIGKQVQRGAGQLADVGRSMMGGVIRDFSQSATSEFRVALRDRMKSPDGAKIVERIRDRVVGHILSAELAEVVSDLLRLPRPEIARVVALVIDHLRTQPLFLELLEQELDAALSELGPRPLATLLSELGLLESTRALVLKTLDPNLQGLMRSPAVSDWLERLLASAGTP